MGELRRLETCPIALLEIPAHFVLEDAEAHFVAAQHKARHQPKEHDLPAIVRLVDPLDSEEGLDVAGTLPSSVASPRTTTGGMGLRKSVFGARVGAVHGDTVRLSARLWADPALHSRLGHRKVIHGLCILGCLAYFILEGLQLPLESFLFGVPANGLEVKLGKNGLESFLLTRFH